MLTHKCRFTLLFSILIIVSTTTAASRLTADGVGYDNAKNIMEKNRLMAFVDEAATYVKDNGREKALEVFNDLKGNFTRDGRYIFAYDYEGRTLALPYQPQLIGTSRIDALDPNGVDFIQQAIDMARMGNGFIYYIYSDLSRNMTQALKLSYVVNVDGTWFLGSGIYAKGEEQTD